MVNSKKEALSGEVTDNFSWLLALKITGKILTPTMWKCIWSLVYHICDSSGQKLQRGLSRHRVPALSRSRRASSHQRTRLRSRIFHMKIAFLDTGATKTQRMAMWNVCCCHIAKSHRSLDSNTHHAPILCVPSIQYTLHSMPCWQRHIKSWCSATVYALCGKVPMR